MLLRSLLEVFVHIRLDPSVSNYFNLNFNSHRLPLYRGSFPMENLIFLPENFEWLSLCAFDLSSQAFYYSVFYRRGNLEDLVPLLRCGIGRRPVFSEGVLNVLGQMRESKSLESAWATHRLRRLLTILTLRAEMACLAML